ncbi:MAG: site-specific integrase [Oscillospiraceae bacterium]|nr:site-specific integrase [Oscillospiraceae bacterium]
MKLPKPRKLPSGSWFIQLRLGGESVSVSALTEKDCINKARLIKSGHKADVRVKQTCGLTLRQAVEKYIAARSNTLSPVTVRGYTIILNNRFQAVMNTPIDKIKDWQSVCNAEALLCSPKTLKNAWGFVKSVLLEQGIIPPKVKLPQIIKKERPFLEPEQIPIFISAIKDKDCEIPALLALHSLRRSEIWAIPEIKNGVIKVRGAVVPDVDNNLVSKPENKNNASRRDINVMIPRLHEVCSNISEIQLRCPDSARAQINRICRKNGLPEVGLHGLRHSFASLAYHLNVPEAYVMLVGGWSDYSTVRKIYTHLAKKDMRKSQQAMADFFNNANEFANAV